MDWAPFGFLSPSHKDLTQDICKEKSLMRGVINSAEHVGAEFYQLDLNTLGTSSDLLLFWDTDKRGCCLLQIGANWSLLHCKLEAVTFSIF